MDGRQFKQLLLDLINEILVVPRGGKHHVDPAPGSNFVLKSGGTKPWLHRIDKDLTCMSVYSVSSQDSDQFDIINVLKAIKDPRRKGDVVVPKGVIENIIDEASGLAVPWLSGQKIDVVTTPQSSKTLSIKFAKKLAENLGARFVAAGTLKDMQSASIAAELPPSFKEKSIRGLSRSLERMKSSETQAIHDYFRPQDRKYIVGWQKGRAGAEISEGNNVLIVDDVLAGGSTFGEMARVLRDGGATVAGCISLFRTGR